MQSENEEKTFGISKGFYLLAGLLFGVSVGLYFVFFN